MGAVDDKQVIKVVKAINDLTEGVMHAFTLMFAKVEHKLHCGTLSEDVVQLTAVKTDLLSQNSINWEYSIMNTNNPHWVFAYNP